MTGGNTSGQLRQPTGDGELRHTNGWAQARCVLTQNNPLARLSATRPGPGMAVAEDAGDACVFHGLTPHLHARVERRAPKMSQTVNR